MDKQSFNLNANVLSNYAGVFIKIVIAVIIAYIVVILINFFRDKFIKKDNLSPEPDFKDLLHILHKLCFLGGFGFILGNIIQVILDGASDHRSPIQFRGNWDYLTFGVILIFIGIGFKKSKK